MTEYDVIDFMVISFYQCIGKRRVSEANEDKDTILLSSPQDIPYFCFGLLLAVSSLLSPVLVSRFIVFQ